MFDARMIFAILFVVALSDTAPLYAENASHRGHVHDKHVHGKAKLFVAVDATIVTMILESPQWNLVGFEGTPKTPEESAALHEARERIADGAHLFSFNKDADCRHVAVESESDLVMLDPDENEAARVHGDSHHNNPHADMQVTYTFACAQPNALTYVSVGLFARFPELVEVEAVALTGEKQIAAALSPKHTSLRLK